MNLSQEKSGSNLMNFTIKADIKIPEIVFVPVLIFCEETTERKGKFSGTVV
jgi:hypothetical protein